MAYEMVMPYHLHMPSYFLETFTEYPFENNFDGIMISMRTIIPSKQIFNETEMSLLFR